MKTVSEVSAVKISAGIESVSFSLRPFLEITKPRLVSLVLWSVFVGFLLASRDPMDIPLLLRTLGGTTLIASGAMALNQLLERERDAKMKRTENRPLPSERIEPGTVLFVGAFLSLAGFLVLTSGTHRISGILSAFTLASYLFVYTPLKTKTPLCTWVGAVGGAVPPMLGWSAARGTLGIEAWILFSILFIWQIPHVLAISWVHREDYARAGFQMLAVRDPQGERVGREIRVYSLALLPLSLVPSGAAMTGPIYFTGAFILGVWFFVLGFRTSFELDRRAKSFFRASILYLTLLFLLMILDKRPI